MRVLLVSPRPQTWSSRRHIPLGLGYLASILEREAHDVFLWDGSVEEEPLSDLLVGQPFDIVGISSVTPLIHEAWEAARQAKTQHSITILGGPHPTLMPDESLEQPQVDLVVRGEAEETIVEIVQALHNDLGQADPDMGQRHFTGTAWTEIAGLSFRNGQGAIVHNPPRQPPHDLDQLPFPAHHLYKIEKYTNLQPRTDGLDPHARSYTIITSRGCPYQCIYCSKAVTGNTWRPRSPENVIEEWRKLVVDLRATEIGVTDDVMTLDLQRAKRICQLLVDEGLNRVPWITIHGIRADNTDLELFGLMKAAGCKRVGFGVESGNQRVLDIMKKHQTIDQVRQAFANARQAGLQTIGFFIFGLPGENEETMEDTIRLALELDPDLANFMIAAPYPGTELYQMVLDEGELFSHDWRDYAIHDEKARFAMGEVTAELVERKWHEAYRRFYLRPSRLLRKGLTAEFWRQFPTYLSDARRFFLSRLGSQT
ncbi:MAG TPA: radical SAM protein [Anaerolineae bacterium]|nr:radical SAM protein [Anaerolineae bacterium]